MTRSFRKGALIAAFAISFSMLSTSSYAFSPEAQQMCTSGAFRFCSSEIPDIPRITACMIKNRASLSSGCRAVMDHEAEQSPAGGEKSNHYNEKATAGLRKRRLPLQPLAQNLLDSSASRWGFKLRLYDVGMNRPIFSFAPSLTG
ncbi:hypothetical protein SAMN05444170_0050 [Bradyrhizobium erythrophlei]|uniref:Cysteine rich repeat-containing protein n=1 Tax=Bradyrhizobium erythrophlei TaxID=1437360 RepID=A0A1M7SR64_9BRAD|nr:hypothetical protein SAMN05444170_0050 [Bradyrhizobium erythrophlei]